MNVSNRLFRPGSQPSRTGEGRRREASRPRSAAFRNRLGALALASLGGFAGCGVEPPPNVRPLEANAVSLDPRNWYVFYSAEMPSHPTADPTGAWSFEFPKEQSGGHVNYVQTPFNATTALHNLTIAFRVESDAPQYAVKDPGDSLPATFHVFFEQQDDNLAEPDGRWWAQPSKYDLGSQDNTTVTIVVPLTPDQWTNVYGQRDATSFYAALNNVGWIGVTFGGQKFFGHGVALSGGSARYILVDLAVD
jgi:hypothetical protein